jgi:hypothetical protein
MMNIKPDTDQVSERVAPVTTAIKSLLNKNCKRQNANDIISIARGFESYADEKKKQTTFYTVEYNLGLTALPANWVAVPFGHYESDGEAVRDSAEKLGVSINIGMRLTQGERVVFSYGTELATDEQGMRLYCLDIVDTNSEASVLTSYLRALSVSANTRRLYLEDLIARQAFTNSGVLAMLAIDMLEQHYEAELQAGKALSAISVTAKFFATALRSPEGYPTDHDQQMQGTLFERYETLCGKPYLAVENIGTRLLTSTMELLIEREQVACVHKDNQPDACTVEGVADYHTYSEEDQLRILGWPYYAKLIETQLAD